MVGAIGKVMVGVGFRVHTGWATLVAAAAGEREIHILQRCRIELVDGNERFVYHRAAEMPISEAERAIATVQARALKCAREGIERAIGNLGAVRACVPGAARQEPGDLTAILRSHPRIHSAEGSLYSGAVARACEQLGLQTITARERDIWRLAAESVGWREADLKAALDGMRGAVGPPWAADHKVAAAAALVSRSMGS